MTQKIKIILIVTCGALLLAVGLWRYKAAGKSQAAHGVIVRDRSNSVIKGCDCTSALVRRALLASQLGAGSTIAVMVTGDGATAYEPILITSFAVPVHRQVLEGRGAAGQQREKLNEDVQAQCEKANLTKVSPIYIALKNAVEHLRSKGCGPVSNCFVYAQTDLQETGDAQIKAALGRATRDNQALPAPINNEGIDVVISGLAETTGDAASSNGRVRNLPIPQDSGRIDRIRSIWLRLFTNPERIRFEPFCFTN
jgi:hypothetical protein